MTSTTQLEGLVNRIEKAVCKMETLVVSSAAGSASSGGAVAAGDTDSPAVSAFQSFLNDNVQPFIVKETAALNVPDLTKLMSLVQSAFVALGAIVKYASLNTKPASDSEFAKVFKPLSDAINAVVQMADTSKNRDAANHMKAIGQSVAALGWIQVTPTPVPYINDSVESGQFYGNRVIKEFKEKSSTPGSANHVTWMRNWFELLKGMSAYVKQHHTTGLTWSRVARAGGAPPPPPPAGAAPPPPPPPPPPAGGGSAADEGGTDRNALFAQLNQGAAVTSGLRKVTDDMKTHKNPALRGGAPPVVAKKPAAAAAGGVGGGAAKSGAPPAKPSKMELVGVKWSVEHFKDRKDLVVEPTEQNHSVYIFRCENCVIKVPAKINSIVIDSCKKTALVFHDLISSLDVINSQSIQVQTTGNISIINVDKTDGIQIYLSAQSATSAQIVAAKSSEMNVLVPTGKDGDFVEHALPEQFKTVFNGKKLVTTATESL